MPIPFPTRPPDPQPPKRAYVLTLVIGADSWERVLSELRQAYESVATVGPRDYFTGGCDSNVRAEVLHDSSMTNEKYLDQLEAYLEATRGR